MPECPLSEATRFNLIEDIVANMLELAPHKLEAMYEEHVATLDHLSLLDQAIRAPRTTRDATLPKYRTHLRKLLSDFEENIEAHFRFEEHHLFPALRDAGRSDLADSLTLDHIALREATKPLLVHVHHALVENLSENEWTEFGRLTLALIQMQRMHMQREESEMIPVLRAMLP